MVEKPQTPETNSAGNNKTTSQKNALYKQSVFIKFIYSINESRIRQPNLVPFGKHMECQLKQEF